MRELLAAMGIRENTVAWYCGDNATPAEANASVPFRGQKAQVYEGGLRVSTVVEWPARIPCGRVSDMNTVTSEVFPTLTEIAEQELPARPIDGINLIPLIEGRMESRPFPNCFWTPRLLMEDVDARRSYIEHRMQKGS